MNWLQAELLTSSIAYPLRYNILSYRKGVFMRFVLVFALILILLSACAPSADSAATALPPGDAARGEQLFTESINGAPACSTCHTIDGGTLVGPSLQGIGAAAQTRIADTSAHDYIYD